MKQFAQLVFQQTGLRLSPRQREALLLYESELMAWNERFNLTAIRDNEEIRVKHFLDSFTCLQVMRSQPGNRLIDIGTGAGFPGLILKIANPNQQVTLVESVGKKVDFCRHIVNALGLEQVSVVQDRAEVLGRMAAHRESYDWATARAVAVLSVLAEYLLPFVRIGGSMLAMKGANAPAEAQAAEHALRVLGGRLRELAPITLPGVVEERYLVVVDKVAATPPAYPRRVGVPSRRPLKA
jgi:16S rRNA (guanine527-N7)-methyltransferase